MGYETGNMGMEEMSEQDLNNEDQFLYKKSKESDPDLSVKNFIRRREAAKKGPEESLRVKEEIAKEEKSETISLTPIEREMFERVKTSNPAFKDLTESGFLELRSLVNRTPNLSGTEFVISGNNNVIMNEKPTGEELKEINPKN